MQQFHIKCLLIPHNEYISFHPYRGDHEERFDSFVVHNPHGRIADLHVFKILASNSENLP
jgi:hypothetical protein